MTEQKQTTEPQPEPIATPEPEPQSEPIATTEPEPKAEPVNPYQSVIENQNSQIAALIEQNNKLTAQITQLVQGGAQIAQAGQPNPQPNPQPFVNNGYGFAQGVEALDEADDLSVNYLGNLIGKR